MFQGDDYEDHYSALKMNASGSFESLIVRYQTVGPNVAED
jgi:hypothetical protein